MVSGADLQKVHKFEFLFLHLNNRFKIQSLNERNLASKVILSVFFRKKHSEWL